MLRNPYLSGTINQLCQPNPNSTSIATSENASRTDAPQIYLKILCISERLNPRITNIFRKENIPVRIAHKFHTLRPGKPYPTPPRGANALETNALSPTPDYVYEEMQCTSSRVIAAVNNILVALHASSTIA